MRKSGGTLITPLLATAACFSSQCSTQPNCHHQTPVKWAFNSRQAVLTTFNFQVSIQRTSAELSLPGSMVPSPASLFILFTSLSINWLVFHHLKLDSYHFARCQRRGGRRGPIFIEKNQRLEEKTILDDILSETYWKSWVSKRFFGDLSFYWNHYVKSFFVAQQHKESSPLNLGKPLFWDIVRDGGLTY